MSQKKGGGGGAIREDGGGGWRLPLSLDGARPEKRHPVRASGGGGEGRWYEQHIGLCVLAIGKVELTEP